MNHICIPKSDFLSRLANIQTTMRQRQLDALLVYCCSGVCFSAWI